ncbi:MAG TPA: ABC transporter permease [Pyrinomonadaceae bacterium]|nr:ABC transporter permease [Pyrinomonadaceae bacterium]
MIDLVLANLRVRPFRTLISVVGVSLGVILVVLFTGLATGMTNDMARRAANWKAEIVFTRSGAMSLDSSNTPVQTAYAERLMQIEGVAATVPVIRYVTANPKGRWGIQQIDGVEWQPFAEMNDMRIIDGRSPIAANEVVVDERQMQNDQITLGETLELFGRPYTVVGVFAPPSGSRIKMSLSAMQEALEAEGRSTYILVKVAPGTDAAAVAARIDAELPGNKVQLTNDMIIDAQQRIPALGTFLRVLVGLGAFVSTIFVLLSMYTTITERRKEIGILKSLGASKAFIIRAIEGEAFLIGILGVVGGLLAAFAASLAIGAIFELKFEFSWGWVFTAVAIALAGSLIGALYPAWRASAIDPVEVMANE